MKQPRNWVPVLGILALISLFLSMPEIPDFFGMFKCKACQTGGPYLPMLGAGYFAVLISISLLFPNFPNALIARSGLIWAILLALKLTYVHLPNWCLACLIGHASNILIWALWLYPNNLKNWEFDKKGALNLSQAKPAQLRIHTKEQGSALLYEEQDNLNKLCDACGLEDSGCQTQSKINSSGCLGINMPVKGRLFMTLFAPIVVAALFSSLNLTFLVYSLKSQHKTLVSNLLPGDAIPAFVVQNTNRTFSNADLGGIKGVVINFVSPSCPYCQEQLPILDTVAAQFDEVSYRFINISPSLPLELMQLSPYSEWFEDKEGALRNLFKVAGFPTLFVVGNDTKILQIIPGIPQEFKSTLFTALRADGSM